MATMIMNRQLLYTPGTSLEDIARTYNAAVAASMIDITLSTRRGRVLVLATSEDLTESISLAPMRMRFPLMREDGTFMTKDTWGVFLTKNEVLNEEDKQNVETLQEMVEYNTKLGELLSYTYDVLKRAVQ